MMEGGTPDMHGEPNAGDMQLAFDVLASEPMQAIRKALHKASWDIVDSYTSWATQREAMAKFLDLPESVVAWVMEGNA